MKYGVSVKDTSKVNEIEASGLALLTELNDFADSLKAIISIEEPPRGIIFHDLESATKLYSTIPLPAYTSRDLIHITPLVETWKEIFLASAGGVDEAVEYYNNLELADVVEIAAHELTHHSDFFHDDFDGDEENMWFEEGLCFYIPRKLIYSAEKFERIMDVEKKLIDRYKAEYGDYTLDKFGEAGYRGGENFSYSAAFYDYWRSTITVKRLVEDYCDGNLQELIKIYTEWTEDDRKQKLIDYFRQKFNMTHQKAHDLGLAE
ncbi:hypothetical protein ACFO3D_18550 [Virgibacillus kekensis]|uniref:Uncharacterized protein n=1 Tax=Virgibacillus kekensis TaxID=202261 RepID=A0ABV9DMP5_9BACI